MSGAFSRTSAASCPCKRIRFPFAAGWTILLFCWPVFAGQAKPPELILTDGSGQSLPRKWEFYIDWNNSYSEKNIANAPFKQLASQTPNLGFQNRTVWFRLIVSNQSKNDNWMGRISYPLLDELLIYKAKDNVPARLSRVGDALPFAARAIEHRLFIFRLGLAPGEQAGYYFCLKTAGSLLLPFSAIREETLKKNDLLENMGLGLYSGIFLALAIINLVLYFQVRDATFLYYFFYITGFGLTQSVLNGLAFQFLWPAWPFINNPSLIFLIGWTFLWGAFFVRSFLHTASIAPALDRVLLALALLMALLVISSFLPIYNTSIRASALLVISFALIVLLAAWSALRQGYRPALYFLIAWGSFLTGISVYSLKGLGLIPSNFWTEYGLQIGSAAEMCLLSLGLGNRMSLLEKEQDILERKSREIEKLKREAELKSVRLENELLKKTIQPHFLINSINASIVWLEENPAQASALLQALCEELRLILSVVHERQIPLVDEIRICQAHLQIMNLRSDRNSKLIVQGDPTGLRIPPLIIHTLVENGWSHSSHPGDFQLAIEKKESSIGITLLTSGPQDRNPEGSGTGLKYVRARLEETWTNQFILEQSEIKDGFRTSIEILA